jgi:hypothetical protein
VRGLQGAVSVGAISHLSLGAGELPFRLPALPWLGRSSGGLRDDEGVASGRAADKPTWIFFVSRSFFPVCHKMHTTKKFVVCSTKGTR